jgi:hypothetical protein
MVLDDSACLPPLYSRLKPETLLSDYTYMARWRARPTGSPQSTVVWTAFNRPNIPTKTTTPTGPVACGAADLLSQQSLTQSSHTKRLFATFWSRLPANQSDGQKNPFDKQIARPDIVAGFPDVNENRFNGLVDRVRVKKIPTPHLAKGGPKRVRRESRKWESVEYSPNFQAIWKRQAVSFSFEKARGRAPPSLSESPEPPLLISYSQVHSKVSSPDFKRTPLKSQSPILPIHMQNIVSWQALHSLCDNMLDMNGAYAKARKKHNRTISQ